jgi:hypothetical protein
MLAQQPQDRPTAQTLVEWTNGPDPLVTLERQHREDAVQISSLKTQLEEANVVHPRRRQFLRANTIF